MTHVARAQGSDASIFRLSEIGSLRPGYAGPITAQPNASPKTIPALQLRDVGTDCSIEWANLQNVDVVSRAPQYMIAERDVLLPLRSTRISSVVAEDVPANTIAAGHWALITVNPLIVDAHFLMHYLRHPAISARLAQLARGTKIQFISVSALKEFEINLPTLEVQRQLARSYFLADRVSQLENQLATVRRELLNAATLQATNIDSSQRTKQRQ